MPFPPSRFECGTFGIIKNYLLAWGCSLLFVRIPGGVGGIRTAFCLRGALWKAYRDQSAVLGKGAERADADLG